MGGVRIGATALQVTAGLPYTVYSLSDYLYIAQALVEVSDKTVDYLDEANNPVLSPNGRWIVCNANFPGPEGDGAIMFVSSSVVGGVPTRLTPEETFGSGQQGWRLHPSWHPNSDRIIYVRGRNGFQGDIETALRSNPGVVEDVVYANPDPSGATGWGVYRPQYNRDGTKVAWIRKKNAAPADGNDGLWVADADGSNLTQIDDFNSGATLNGYLFDGDQFQWGPGDVIYYVRFEGNGDTQQQIYKINADGTGMTQLSTDGTTSLKPSRINARSLAPNDDFLIGTCMTSVDFANSWDFYRWELDGSGGTLLGTLAADGRSLGNTQNFRNCYVHVDGRVYYVYGRTQGQIASFLPDGSDWQLDVDLGVNMDGDQFYTGSAIQWI